MQHVQRIYNLNYKLVVQQTCDVSIAQTHSGQWESPLMQMEKMNQLGVETLQ